MVFTTYIDISREYPDNILNMFEREQFCTKWVFGLTAQFAVWQDEFRFMSNTKSVSWACPGMSRACVRLVCGWEMWFWVLLSINIDLVLQFQAVRGVIWRLSIKLDMCHIRNMFGRYRCGPGHFKWIYLNRIFKSESIEVLYDRICKSKTDLFSGESQTWPINMIQYTLFDFHWTRLWIQRPERCGHTWWTQYRGCQTFWVRDLPQYYAQFSRPFINVSSCREIM